MTNGTSIDSVTPCWMFTCSDLRNDKETRDLATMTKYFAAVAVHRAEGGNKSGWATSYRGGVTLQ